MIIRSNILDGFFLCLSLSYENDWITSLFSSYCEQCGEFPNYQVKLISFRMWLTVFHFLFFFSLHLISSFRTDKSKQMILTTHLQLLTSIEVLKITISHLMTMENENKEEWKQEDTTKMLSIFCLDK